MTKATFRLRLFFDAGSSTCLWAGNDAASTRWGYSIAAEQLPVSENLRRKALHLCAWYDTSLDWEHPSGPSPWSAHEARSFAEAVATFVAQLRAALGHDFEVVVEFPECEAQPPG